MKNYLLSQKSNYGIDDIGFTLPIKLDEIKDLLKSRKESGLDAHFECKDINNRISPQIFLKCAKSIICIAISYNSIWDVNKNKVISSSTYGIDYHKILKEKLNYIANDIKTKYNKLEYIAVTDTLPLVDRYIAFLCKLGTYGRNTQLINKKLGSKFFIGYLITNLDLNINENEIIKKPYSLCGLCKKCMILCPTNAIRNDFTIDANKCISYLSQNKHSIDKENLQHYTLYGCDICTDVCKENERAKKVSHAFLKPSENELYPDINKVSISTNKEIKMMYPDSNILWQGSGVIRRNAEIILKKDSTI